MHHGCGCHVQDPTTTNSKTQSHLEQQLVEVLPAEHGVAVCRLHLKHASATKKAEQQRAAKRQKEKKTAQLHRLSSRVNILPTHTYAHETHNKRQLQLFR